MKWFDSCKILSVSFIILPSSQMRKLNLKEFKRTSLGHTARWQESLAFCLRCHHPSPLWTLLCDMAWQDRCLQAQVPGLPSSVLFWGWCRSQFQPPEWCHFPVNWWWPQAPLAGHHGGFQVGYLMDCGASSLLGHTLLADPCDALIDGHGAPPSSGCILQGTAAGAAQQIGSAD